MISRKLERAGDPYRLLVLAATSALVVSPSHAHGQGRLHPLPELVVEHGAPVRETIRMEVGSGWSLPRAFVALLDLQLSFSVGLLDGDVGQVFGQITDVTVGPKGRLFVLDGRLSVVRVYDVNGRLEESIGGPGRGPGEFVGPVAVSVSGGGELLVADIDHTVSVFAPSQDGHEFVERWPIGAAPNDVCEIGGTVFVQVSPGGVQAPIRAFDLAGSQGATFPPVYRSGKRRIQMEINRGKLVCVDARNLVVYASGMIGELRAYHPDGTAVWSTSFEGYRPMELRELGPNAMSARFTEAGSHSFLALSPTGNDYLVVQVAVQTLAGHEARLPYTAIETYLVDLQSGRGRRLGESLPHMGSTDSGYWVEVQQLPFPQVRVHGDLGSAPQR